MFRNVPRLPAMAANDGAPEFQVGARVIVHHSVGVVRYIGETEFADGEWIGVELDYPGEGPLPARA